MIRKIIANAQAAYIAIVCAATEAVSGSPLQPIRIENPRGRRGATFIEYALLAAVAVAIIAVFRTQLGTIIGRLINNISDGI